MTLAITPPTAPRSVLEVAGSQLLGRLEMPDVSVSEIVSVMRAQVFRPGKGDQPPSDAEVAAALMVAVSYGLNPFKREIFLIPTDRGYMPYVGVDGWATLSAGRYKSLRFTYVDDERGNPISCTCHMDTGTCTFEVTEYVSECRRSTKPWEVSPRRQIRHKTFNQTCRIAFGVSGVIDDEEPQGFDPEKAVGAPSEGRSRLQALVDARKANTKGAAPAAATVDPPMLDLPVVSSSTAAEVQEPAKAPPVPPGPLSYRDDARPPEGTVVFAFVGVILSVNEVPTSGGKTFYEIVARDVEKHDMTLATWSTTARDVAKRLIEVGSDVEIFYYEKKHGARTWRAVVSIIEVGS